jgi:hypothetical protein
LILAGRKNRVSIRYLQAGGSDFGLQANMDVDSTSSHLDRLRPSYSFNLLYDSSTYPSQVQVESATYIDVSALGVFASPPLTEIPAGQPAFVRSPSAIRLARPTSPAPTGHQVFRRQHGRSTDVPEAIN